MKPIDSHLALFRPTVAEIDLDAFARNVDAIARRLPAGSRLMAVLKADGYGHGAVELARCCLQPRVEMLAVALIEEAVELREAGIALPILVLGTLTPSQLPLVVQNELVAGIVSPEALGEVVDFARRRRRRIHVHLKLDSGMGRTGLVDADLPLVIEQLRSSSHVEVDAIYTHFANASDPKDSFTTRQLRKFAAMRKVLAQGGISGRFHHLANSAATMSGVVTPGDWVRVGLALYGAEALDEGGFRLEPVMRWRTRIIRLKQLDKGSFIGYGTTFKTKRKSRIATLPVGYADGYNRLLSNQGEVLIRGKRAPVVGRVSMDLVTIDVTRVRGAEVGDEVVLLGAQGKEEITAEELARKTKTISYEVFCQVSARVPRVYLSGRRVVGVRSRFG